MEDERGEDDTGGGEDLDEEHRKTNDILTKMEGPSSNSSSSGGSGTTKTTTPNDYCFKAVAFGRDYFHALGGTTPRYDNNNGDDDNDDDNDEDKEEESTVCRYEWDIPPWIPNSSSSTTTNSSVAKSFGSRGNSGLDIANKILHSSLRVVNGNNNHRKNTLALDPSGAVLQAVATSQSTLFLTQAGRIYQTGTFHGFVNPSPTAVTIPLPIPAVEIAAGRHFCLARMQGGVAVCSWGAGHFGQLGIGPAPGENHQPITFTSKPVLIERLLPRVIGSPVRQVAAGDWHGLALTESGMVWAWGSNRSQQCGIKHKSSGGQQPQTAVDPETQTIVVPTLVVLDTEMTQVAAGRSHSLALSKVSQQVYSWGNSIYGQCGQTTRRTPQAPRVIDSLRELTIAKIAAAGNHNLALTMGGRLFSWGQQSEGQLGLGQACVAQPKPRLVSELDFVAIVAGQEYKRIQQQDKDIGSSSEADKPPTAPLESMLKSIPRIVDVFAGPSYSVALSSSGHAYCFGSNDAGQLGLPTPLDLPMSDNSLPPGAIDFMPVSQTSSKRSAKLLDVHVQTFDSRHNVLLPTRVDSLVDHMRIQTVACGPNHLWFLGCERNDESQPAPVGRTLHEVQQDRQRQPSSQDEKSSQQLNNDSNDEIDPSPTSQQGQSSSLPDVSASASKESWENGTNNQLLKGATSPFESPTEPRSLLLEGKRAQSLEATQSSDAPDDEVAQSGSCFFVPRLSPRSSPSSAPRGKVASRWNRLRKRLAGRKLSEATKESLDRSPESLPLQSKERSAGREIK